MNRDATFVSVKVRLRKNCIGSMGALARSSHATNPATSRPPATSATTMPGLAHPCEFPLTSPQTIPSRPALASPSPGRSRLESGPFVSSSRESASGASTRPIGTLSQKIQCQETPLTIAPPTSGPIAIARPPIPPQIPSASPRRSLGTAAERIVRVSGVTIAPPTPCTARAMSSWFAVVASAAAAEAAVKISRPTTNMRRRPKRSPSAAPVSRSTAKVSVYALTVHSSCEIDAFRSWRITGRAVVTTRLSRLTMNRATEVIASVQIIERFWL